VPDTLKKTADDLKEKVDALNKRLSLGGLRESGDDPTEYVPPTVTQRLLRLSAGLDGYTTPPTGPQLEELSVLAKHVSDLEAAWKKLSDQDIASFNKAVAAAGLTFLATK
jgi:hypothetical protein